MSLFQKSVVNKYLTNLDNTIINKAYDQFKQFYGDAERIENIRLLKEENYQEGFLREIFVDVLGYTINPNINYNLTTEYKNETDSKKADGAILFNGQAIGVIELKSTKTPNLDSIREQAFNYKNHQPNCRFVITSNFEKLRLYIDNATDWEEFNLFNLDFENFRRFYLFLSKHSISVGITAKLKEESKLHEENISNQLYRDYSVFKNQLYNDLIKLNPGQDKLSLFHKSQKLLDRILFVLFAEDRLLIPPNTISEVISQWNIFKKYDDPKPLYFHFVKLFNHLDSGYKYDTYELHAYNGGLFKKDELLDDLIISDELLHSNTITLSKYGYNSEVDVNILGHIFENSITEIEQVKAEIEGEQTDKNRSRRKKEGIFYTPKYITKYIVDNTVGALCNEKKKELGIDGIENEIIENSRTAKGKLSKKAETLLKKLDDYRTYLLSLKILDPACGSGAFLNQALEFLINEHELIDSYRRELEQDSLGLYDTTKSILENNLYGVDINEEAVEIAKLSLWIRTAERGRKLSDLNNNIKCGNSLIDDPAVAGDKAFDWKKEFPEIMKDGGFDVVIGNPPYVQHRKLINFSDYFRHNYLVYTGTSDLSVYFYEKAVNILKKHGLLCLINTNKYFNTEYGKPLREFLANYQIIEIINFEQVYIFKEALVSSTITVIQKKDPQVDTNYIEFRKEELDISLFDTERKKRTRKYSIEYFKKNSWLFNNLTNSSIINKIKSKGVHFGEISDFIIKRGVTSGCDESFLVETSDQLNLEYPELSKKILRGKDINRYALEESNYNLLFIPWHFPLHNDPSINGASTEAEILMQSRYTNLYQHLLKHKNKLVNRNKSETGIRYEWYALQRCAASYYQLFDQSKIVWGLISGTWGFAYDTDQHYLTSASFFLTSKEYNLKYILALLNSKLYHFYFKNIGEMTAGGAYVLKKTSIDKFILPKIDSNLVDKFILLASNMIELNKGLKRKKSNFLSRVKDNFDIDKQSIKINSFYKHDFKTFLSELKKKKVTLTLKQQDEWEQYFNEYKKEINKLQQQINHTDKEIDQLVYKLYGLTEEEISIVEGATSS